MSKPVLALFLALLLLCGRSFGFYVIPYELRPFGPGTKEVYTVLVILADYYDNYFGQQDGLTTLLARSHHADPEMFVSDYIKIPNAWYLKHFAESKGIYGAKAEVIAEAIAQMQPIKAGRTSAVVITEHKNINNVLFFLRVDPPGADGLLCSQRTFQDKGLTKAFPTIEPEFQWRETAIVEPEAFLPELHQLENGAPREELVHWLEGDRLELKNYAIDSAHHKKFFRDGFRIAHRHKMFIRGGSLFPENIKTYPDGTLLPKDAHLRYGIRATQLMLATFTQEMSDQFEKMTFSDFDRINNEHTFDVDLFFKLAEVPNFQKKLIRLTNRSDARRERDYLSYDADMATTLRMVKCGVVHSALAQ